MEIFRQISHHPNYEISNYGQVKNGITGQLLKPTLHINKKCNTTPYLRIELKNPRKKFMVHRLVAEAFIENPLLLKSINHKDEDGLNNHVSNLEWCTARYNCIYSQGSRVRQLDLEGSMIDVFDSLTLAAEHTGSDFRLISAVCVGKRNKHNNYKWEYANN